MVQQSSTTEQRCVQDQLIIQSFHCRMEAEREQWGSEVTFWKSTSRLFFKKEQSVNDKEDICLRLWLTSVTDVDEPWQGAAQSLLNPAVTHLSSLSLVYYLGALHHYYTFILKGSVQLGLHITQKRVGINEEIMPI